MLSLSSAQKAFCLKDSVEKRQYLARLLICGGTRLFREKFDSIHKPENLELTLNDPAITRELKTILRDQEWNCLYPQNPGKRTSSANFDLWLTLKLLRTISGLTPPATGWHAMPYGFSFEEDLARIECYCSSLYDQKMTDAIFNYLWKAISEAFLRIAGGISPEKISEWEISIDEFLQDPVTSPEANEYVDQLRYWKVRGLADVMMTAGNALYESFQSKYILNKICNKLVFKN